MILPVLLFLWYADIGGSLLRPTVPFCHDGAGNRYLKFHELWHILLAHVGWRDERMDARLEKVQGWLESVTRRWWFYLLLVALLFLPAHAAKGYNPAETPKVVVEVLSSAFVFSQPALYPVAKVIPILLLAGIIFSGDRVTRLFSVYAAVNLGAVALLQNMAQTEHYGFAVLVANVVEYLLVAASWASEAIVKRTSFEPASRPIWRYWVVLPAFLAFWNPINMRTLAPDFNPVYILTSNAGLASCNMVPVYLAMLTLYYPKSNKVTMRVTGFVGFLTGLLALFTFFEMPQWWWLGVLHLPLPVVSLYAFVMSFRRGT